MILLTYLLLWLYSDKNFLSYQKNIISVILLYGH